MPTELETQGMLDAGDEELELPAPAANSAADETPAEEGSKP